MKNRAKNILMTCLFLVLISINAIAQEPIDWSYLGDVSFEKKFSDKMGFELHHATFGKMAKAYDGKEVKITGYMIPMDALGITYVLSKNPNSTCFFCGSAGPETVLELEMKPSAIQRYEVDQIKTWKGTLKLNAVNDKQLTYVLLEAELDE